MSERFKTIVIASLLLILLGVLCVFAYPDTMLYSDRINSLGISFITAGVLAIFLDKYSLTAISQELNSVVRHGLGELNIRDHGVTDVIEETPYKEIHAAIDCSKHFTLVQSWSPQLKNTISHIETMLNRGGIVEIYLLHPDSCSAKQRSIDLGVDDSQHVPGLIRNDTRLVRSLYNRSPAKDIDNRLSLRYYAGVPAFALYKADNLAWLALYWHGTQSDYGTNFVVDLNLETNVKQNIELHLEALKNNSTLVDLSCENTSSLASSGCRDSAEHASNKRVN